MDPVSPQFNRLYNARLVVEPLRPSCTDGTTVEIGFSQFDKQVIMPGLAFHKAAVELAQVGVIEAFTEPFEPLAASGFDKGEDEQSVEKALFFAAPFPFEFPELIDV